MSPPLIQSPIKKAIRAFTMIEVIVSLAIMATALLAIFIAMRSSASAAIQAGTLTKATLLAESLLTEILTTDDLDFNTTQGKRDRFQWKIQIAPTPIDNLAAVNIKISWPFANGFRHYELLTLRCIEPKFQGN
jgi:prepilin-type N-terminal cleavage/methylation domain-containing protein